MKKWLKAFFGLDPKVVTAEVEKPICGHCGSADVQIIGTAPVRKFLCRVCCKSTEGTELAIVPVKDNQNVWRLPSRTRTFDMGQFALNNERRGPGILGNNDEADRIDAMANRTSFGRFG